MRISQVRPVSLPSVLIKLSDLQIRLFGPNMGGHDWSTVMEFFRTILETTTQPVPLDYVIIYTGYDDRLLSNADDHQFNETFLNECADRQIMPLFVNHPSNVVNPANHGKFNELDELDEKLQSKWAIFKCGVVFKCQQLNDFFKCLDAITATEYCSICDLEDITYEDINGLKVIQVHFGTESG
jgi:hypothetical protein